MRNFLVGSLLVAAVLAGAPVQAATWSVDTTGDGGDINIGDGTCRTSGGAPRCTFRAALEEANAAAGLDTINFNIAPAGAKTIVLTGNLPTITSPVIIDGTTQPGFVASAPFAPVIELNSAALTVSVLQLRGGSSGSTIRGLCINRGTFNAIDIQNSANNVIAGNFLGTNLAGTAAGPGTSVGVYIGGGFPASNNNRIGGTVPADRNIISANTNDGIQINGNGAGADNNLIQGNYIGLDVTGTLDVGNTNTGVSIFGGSSNSNTVIGGTVAGAGNVIAGNGDHGILIASAGTTGTLVQGNRIGTNAAGTAGIPNTNAGVRFDAGTANNTVGGTVAGAGNLIAYNGSHGVRLTASGGTGERILGNAIHSNGALGIDLNEDAVTANDLGDSDTGPNNRQNFPVLSAATTNGAGSAHFAGSLNGAASTVYRIEFFASTATDPSGFGEGQRYLDFTDVTTNAAGFAIIGVTLATAVTAGEYVTATATDPSNNTSEFAGALQAVGRLVVTTTTDTVDGITTSVSNLIAFPGGDGQVSLREAILAANATGGADTITFGIPLTDANHFYYQNDAIGGSLTNIQPTTRADLATPSSPIITDYDPDYPTGTARSWYRIQPASALPAITDALILDATTQPLSIVGGGPVIEVDGTSGGGNTLELVAGSSGSAIRGLVMNRTPGHAILLRTSNNVVAGNFLGTNVAGTAPGPGNHVGVRIAGGGAAANNNNRIGGTVPADRNVLSGNLLDGVMISGGVGGAANNLVQGNYIGVDVTGTLDLGNTFQGIAVFGTSNTNTEIGGTAPGAGNVISGNGGDGIGIEDVGTTGTLVRGNKIGTNAAGTAGIPNTNSGVRIEIATSSNTVGGTAAGAGNLIAYNNPGNTAGVAGVQLRTTAGTGNSILGNVIHSNGGLGIDLNQDGVTANDAGDGDPGPNDLLNFPLLTAIYPNAGTLTVHFQLDVQPQPVSYPASYRIEFFKNPSGADMPTGFGEGQVFAATRNVTVPAAGPVFFNHAFAGVVGDVITATATFCTDGAACTTFGSTSEFSKALSVVPTAVTLLSFSAEGRDGAVDLSWTTASELSNLGFHLYRAEAAGGPFTRITASLIPGLGSSPTGQSYAYRDSVLENGRTYYYLLEDVETTGRTERHGPVSATPSSGTSRERTGSTYGDPSGVVLREIERDAGHVLLELLTPGFEAAPTGDGRVRVSIPGFTSVSEAGEPSLPTRRAFVEATAGKRVHLVSVMASDELRFPGLRPTAQGAPGIEVDESGTVLISEEKRGEGRAFDGVFPSESAHLVGTSFQGETKKAELLLFPLRWDGSGLVLSRRLVVRLDFAGTESTERSLGGSRGRRPVVRSRRVGRGLVAQLVARERGLYALAFEDVFPDRPNGMAAGLLRLSRQGEDVALHVEPDPTRFAPGSTLYFLSEGSLLNPYGDAVYELETGVRGMLMPVDPLSPAKGPVDVYYETVRKEENHYYQSGLLDAPDLWLWDLLVSPAQTSYTFAADHVSATRPSYVSVSLQGASDFTDVVDHHVRVSVNGTSLGETTWDGKEPKSLDLELEPGVLREGLNTLELESVADTGASYSLVFLNRFSVRYPRKLVASGGTLEGSFASSGQATVEGLLPSSVLLDTTGIPRWRRGGLLTPRGLSFPVDGGRRYLATSHLQRPLVRKIQGSALRKTENQADYLLLAPRAFLPAAQPLLDLRESEGLATMAVPLEDLYEQFGHGEVSPAAIKAFLEYAYHSWAAPSPRYVVLLGDASYDPRDHLQTGVKDWLPGFSLKTSYLWTVSDPAYASVNGTDLLPDLAIGRLPAGSLGEAQGMVEKILGYENGGGRLDGPAVLVADNTDAAGSFEQDADEIASGVLRGREVRKIYYSQQGANTRALIEEAFDEGASLMSYVGHGATAVWASENIFNYQDVKNLAPQSRQPLVMTMNCLNGFFQFPPLNSLSEELLKAEGKGAIAAFSPSGLSVEDAAHVYHEALLREILSGRHARLGDAVLAAQGLYGDTGAFPELLAIYHLFGDPALRIR